MRLAFSGFVAQLVHAKESAPLPDLTRNIPPRLPNALTGSQFAESISNLDRQQRERAILDQLLVGNVPDFSRKLAAVKVSSREASATIFVMPEYLAIGSDRDFLRIPMNFHTAATVAHHFGFVLPTRKMVDAVYDQAGCQFNPQPMPAGPEMTSTGYYRIHNSMIEAQSEIRAFPRNALVAGHKKDVVLTNRLIRIPGRIAIYGWHRAPGLPIQPLSTVHGAGYADYSHGIRLVADRALVQGRIALVRDILGDPSLAATLSDEGTVHLASIFRSAGL